MGTRVTRWLAGAAVIAGVAVWYPVRGRRHVLTWGASDREAAARYPGDDLLPDPTLITTRAITIAAPPKTVWPWLVQMGSGRAGAYTYDWIENLFGLDMHSAEEIVPDWQHLAVGDELPLGKGAGMLVRVVDAPRALVVQSDDGNWVWEFILVPVEDGTRLLSRNRIRLARAPRSARIGYRLVMEPGSLVMERKMLRGIRARAEGAPSQR